MWIARRREFKPRERRGCFSKESKKYYKSFYIDRDEAITPNFRVIIKYVFSLFSTLQLCLDKPEVGGGRGGKARESTGVGDPAASSKMQTSERERMRERESEGSSCQVRATAAGLLAGFELARKRRLDNLRIPSPRGGVSFPPPFRSGFLCAAGWGALGVGDGTGDAARSHRA